ncbi:MAG: response regulator transcription factor [Anaerolineae bacterium]
MFVLLAEDDSFNRLGLGLFLKQAGYDVIEATDARTARSLAAVWPLDVAIVDIVLPLEPGLLVQQTANVGVDLARDLKHIRPGMGVVIFSAYPDRGSGVFEMLRNGTRGIAYKLKGCDPADFLDAVNAVVAGRVVIDGEITDAASLANELLRQLSNAERPWVETVLGSIRKLSKRELEIASMLAASQTVRHIAETLVLAPKTVENHRDRIYTKLGLTSQNQTKPRSRQLKQDVILVKSFVIYDLQQRNV